MAHPRDEADRLLLNIALNQALMNRAQRLATEEIEQVKRRHADYIARMAANVATCEKDLERLVKTHKAAILAGRDRADLASGSVMLKLQRRVRQVKGMLGRLKAAGLTSAVRVAKEVVDWDRVEKFNDATLARLGTARVEKEHFSYELKTGDGNKTNNGKE